MQIYQMQIYQIIKCKYIKCKYVKYKYNVQILIYVMILDINFYTIRY